MRALIDELAPGMESYLDVGCGTGNYLIPLAKMFKKAMGVDLNEGMLGECKEKVKTAGLSDKITLKQGLA